MRRITTRSLFNSLPCAPTEVRLRRRENEYNCYGEDFRAHGEYYNKELAQIPPMRPYGCEIEVGARR